MASQKYRVPNRGKFPIDVAAKREKPPKGFKVPSETKKAVEKLAKPAKAAAPKKKKAAKKKA